uniref:Uncharacterized protein n=1 Tax=Avena sativa TaxID=4498 RepID=A0ACD6ALH1_AVESA
MPQSRVGTGQGSLETAACEIDRLPEELLAAVISLTSPPDACRAAAVSRTFRPAADSDAVWSCFLPRDLPQFAEGELPGAAPSKKALFRRLSDQPALLPCKLVSMQLDRATGAKCYTLSARSLHIAWGDTPQYWEWIDLGIDEVKRFSEAAKLRGVWWLDIRGKINRMMLSENLTYAAYMVFKLADDGFNLLHSPFQDATVSVAGSDSTQQVCLQSYMEVGDDGVPQKHILSSHIRVPLTDDIVLPRKRADGWMEVELGEFYNEEGYDDEVSVSLMETHTWKYGLVVWGIEIRVKK